MKNTVKKTAIILVAITAIALVFGNPLMAEDRTTGNLISDADLAFIKAAPKGITTRVVTGRQTQPVGLIAAADYAFIARAYSESSGNFQVQVVPEAIGLITAADYRFLTGGQAEDAFSVYSYLEDSLAGHLPE